MAVVAGDVLRLKIFQNLLGQQVLNVQHYQVSALSPQPEMSLNGFAEAAALSWHSLFAPVQGVQVTYVRATLEKVNAIDLDEYAYEPATTGTRAGEPMPPFVSFGIRQVRANRLTRHGQKRIPGVLESDIAAGVLVQQTINAVQNQAELAFSVGQTWLNQQIPGRTMGLVPVIYGGVDATYPLGRINDIVGIVVNTSPTTQNTRKIRTRDGL